MKLDTDLIYREKIQLIRHDTIHLCPSHQATPTLKRKVKPLLIVIESPNLGLPLLPPQLRFLFRFRPRAGNKSQPN